MQKILVDTNVLLRYLVDGDKLLVETTQRGVVWLLDEVVIELVFALEKHYGQTREMIFDWVTRLLMKPGCDSNRSLLFNTLAIFRDQANLSIVDAYLHAFSHANGVELVTLDKKLKGKMAR
jgi:predicted nucleic-acid-binding protein